MGEYAEYGIDHQGLIHGMFVIDQPLLIKPIYFFYVNTHNILFLQFSQFGIYFSTNSLKFIRSLVFKTLNGKLFSQLF